MKKLNFRTERIMALAVQVKTAEAVAASVQVIGIIICYPYHWTTLQTLIV